MKGKKRRRYTLCPKCQGSLINYVSINKEKVICTLCQGEGTYLDRPLSRHFRLYEFLFSQTALRKGLDNSPSPETVSNLKRLAIELLEPVRKKFGPIHVTSGYRSSDLNIAIGGAPTSAHQLGGAADIIPVRRIPLKTIVDWVIARKLTYDQVIFEGTWIHLGLFKETSTNPPRRQELMMFGGKYYKYDPKDSRVRGVES